MPEGTFIIIETAIDPDGFYERDRVALQIAEAAALVTLRFPHALQEKVYEGTINTEGASLLWDEGSITLTVSPVVTPADVAEAFGSDASALQHLDGNRRERFQLASRWYRRGHETLNQVDKFLFWWTVLEVYPGEGERNIVWNIKHVLRMQVFPHLSKQKLEEGLRIGPIYQERKGIVHEGKAFVSHEDKHFSECLERLRAVATTCLRLLGGLPLGDDLDPYLGMNK